MKETAVSFGAGGNLSGVLCEADKPLNGAPCALMWNVGIHHRVGAFRIWVDLARRLASMGFASLRFDLSGMGDSDARKGTDEDIERKDDLDEAMALVTKRTGLTTFAPIGFCSGIDQLHALGLRDPRVVAMGYIEGYAWRTRGFYLRYPLRYLRSTLWKDRLEHLPDRPALKRFRKYLQPKKNGAPIIEPGKAEDAAQVSGATMFARHRPEMSRFAEDLKALRARNVKMFFAYFGIDTDFNHPGQFEEMTGMKPDEKDVRLFFLGAADHILYRSDDRALTVAETASWLKQGFA